MTYCKSVAKRPGGLRACTQGRQDIWQPSLYERCRAIARNANTDRIAGALKRVAIRTFIVTLPSVAKRLGGLRACRAAKAELTVFLALITVIISAMLLLILESARVQGSRLYMTVAANSSIDSLFSQYHRKLWEEYRLLGLEHYAYDQISDEMSDFIKPYFEAENWYPIELSEIGIEDMRLLVEDDASYYEQEVIDYMHYGIAASVWSLIEADDFTDSIKDGTSVNGMSDLYEGHAREAMRLEEAIEDIGSNLTELDSHYNRAAACLEAYNGRGFVSEAKLMIKCSEQLPKLVEVYIRKADRMKEGLESSRKQLDAEFESGNLSQSSRDTLNEDISEYESYVAEDGARRSEISGFTGRAENNISFLNDVITEAEEVMDYISSWEPEDEDDELDEESLWSPVISHFHSFDLITLGAKHGIQDKETEKKLENIKTLINGQLLKLVLPQGATLSTEEYSFGDKPSDNWLHKESVLTAPLADRLYLAEYTAQLMDYFGRGSFDADSTKTGSGHTEIEYILYGLNNDTDNLNATVKRLVAIRTGLNLIYLYSDTAKREEARTLALSITGAFGLTPLVTVTAFMIMSIWALGQAVCDVKHLLGGGKVPLMHDAETFSLSLTGLLGFNEAGFSENTDSTDGGKGLKYLDYLRLLLFFSQNTEQDYRCMDIIQMNLIKTQSDFRFDRLIYSLEAEVNVKAGHVFSMLGTVQNSGYQTASSYNMSVKTAYSY